MGNMEQVGHTLEAFAAQCHDFVKAEPGPAGRQKICKLLSQVLLDEQFVAKYVDSNDKERNILYEDPEFGFCIIAHNYEGPKESVPHDHGGRQGEAVSLHVAGGQKLKFDGAVGGFFFGVVQWMARGGWG